MTTSLSATKPAKKSLLDTDSVLCEYPCKMVPGPKKELHYDRDQWNNHFPMYGQITVHPNTGLDRNFTRDFVVADVQNTLKEVNFLTYFRLYVDYQKKLLAE